MELLINTASEIIGKHKGEKKNRMDCGVETAPFQRGYEPNQFVSLKQKRKNLGVYL